MRISAPRLVAAVVALPWLLAGCTVPGRGLVGPAPQRPTLAVVQGMEAQSGRVPLVTIAASAGPEDYLSALAGAVQAAEARKPDVVFDVLSAVPQTGTPVHQIDAAKGLTPDAAEVANAIAGDGVPVARITLGAVVVPGIADNQVRVYVR
jgi:hypothetical protein